MAYVLHAAAVPADTDPPYWNPDWTLGDILQQLGKLAPDDLKGIELIAIDCLRRRLKQRHDAMLAEWLG